MIMGLLFILDLLFHAVDLNNIKHELMPTAWHPTRRWYWCMTKDEKLWNGESNNNLKYFTSFCSLSIFIIQIGA